jgi:hypothetical protein
MAESLTPHPPNPQHKETNMDQRSKPYFFAFETKSKPGKFIAHCVRFETVEIEADPFDHTKFTILGADIETDPRVKQMISCAAGFKARNPEFFKD